MGQARAVASRRRGFRSSRGSPRATRNWEHPNKWNFEGMLRVAFRAVGKATDVMREHKAGEVGEVHSGSVLSAISTVSAIMGSVQTNQISAFVCQV